MNFVSSCISVTELVECNLDEIALKQMRCPVLGLKRKMLGVFLICLHGEKGKPKLSIYSIISSFSKMTAGFLYTSVLRACLIQRE
jgi:hypothetical protein